MQKRKPGAPRKGWKDAARKRHEPKRDPLRNNPIVGGMSDAQAERILAEMREEESRVYYSPAINLSK